MALWDLASRRRSGDPLTGHTHAVWSVAVAELDGRPVAVTGGFDAAVRVRNLVTGHEVGEPFAGHDRAVTSVAVTTVNGRLVAVTGGYDSTVRFWDLTTGRLSRVSAGHSEGVWDVAVPLLDGRPGAVSCGGDGTVRVWDLPAVPDDGGQCGPMRAVVTASVDGRPTVVTADDGRGVRRWDLATGAPGGDPLIGHTGPAHALATTVVDGRPVAVTGGHDSTVRLWEWNLATGEETGAPVVTALSGPHPFAVTGTWHGALRLRDLATTVRPAPHPPPGATASPSSGSRRPWSRAVRSPSPAGRTGRRTCGCGMSPTARGSANSPSKASRCSPRRRCGGTGRSPHATGWSRCGTSRPARRSAHR